ncbi:MAG: hypothetical protein RBT82_12500 [Desulfomonilia bacterium]|jgi:DNA-directed RNA polymerase subunit RPC12/RpoP|nr:hypothetical protein [Desulfomonilia bacterium]
MICHDCGYTMLRWQVPPANPQMVCPRCGRRYNLATRAVVPGDPHRVVEVPA